MTFSIIHVLERRVPHTFTGSLGAQDDSAEWGLIFFSAAEWFLKPFWETMSEDNLENKTSDSKDLIYKIFDQELKNKSAVTWSCLLTEHTFNMAS